jgi:hypothetical protein
VNDEFKDIADARSSGGIFGMVRIHQLSASNVRVPIVLASKLSRLVQIGMRLGKFFVRGIQSADKALVKANALESVDVMEEAPPMTPEQVNFSMPDEGRSPAQKRKLRSCFIFLLHSVACI